MNHNDFDIQNGVLTEYRGKGGNVTVPDGVKQIGDFAFCDCFDLKAEWQTIQKSNFRNDEIPTKRVVCRDGKTPL